MHAPAQQLLLLFCPGALITPPLPFPRRSCHPVPPSLCVRVPFIAHTAAVGIPLRVAYHNRGLTPLSKPLPPRCPPPLTLTLNLILIQTLPACTGGWTEDAIAYAAAVGVASEGDMPYLGQNAYCKWVCGLCVRACVRAWTGDTWAGRVLHVRV